ncbi:FecR domain-containing protein [uncultured Marinobacter sp.]|uniref:FecR domain-containing protein n=1 Tax=uncultured Marinobacter sp. TaxID=187379 RepID=UPI0030DA3D59
MMKHPLNEWRRPLVSRQQASPTDRFRQWLKMSVLAVCLGWPAVAPAEFNIARGSDIRSAGVANASSNRSGTAGEWRYTMRSGETLQQIATELLTSNINAQRLASYNQIAVNSALRAGDTLRIPVPWLTQQPEPAVLTAITGQVQIRTASTGQVRRASGGERIRAGDTLITSSGTATVELADGSVVRINPASQIVFNRLTRYGREGMTDTRMRLNRGSMSNRVKPLIEGGSRFEVETPSAIAAVRGTAFAIQTDDLGSYIQVTEGDVDFGAPGRTRIVPAGYAATVKVAGNSPVNLRRLPPRPETRPVPDTVNQLPIELGWEPTGAGNYQIDILDADSGNWLRREHSRDPRYAMNDLANGRYTIEIAALTPDGLSGMPGTLQFQVDLAARAAELVRPEAGATLDSDQPEFQWQFTGENESGRVEVATDQDFQQVVSTSDWTKGNSSMPGKPLNPGQYFWRVVTEAGETSVATSETRPLIVNGMLPPVRVISTNYIERQVRIFWETVETADGYRLQLSEDPSFREVIKEADVNDTTAALRLIPGRRYFVRLKAVSDGPLAGRWGPGRELFVE